MGWDCVKVVKKCTSCIYLSGHDVRFITGECIGDASSPCSDTLRSSCCNQNQNPCLSDSCRGRRSCDPTSLWDTAGRSCGHRHYRSVVLSAVQEEEHCSVFYYCYNLENQCSEEETEKQGETHSKGLDLNPASWI